MQELVGRLTALDPEASESLKVVGYFDALVGGQVSVEVLTRSAAVLAGCTTGLRLGANARVVRATPVGARLGDASPDGWPSHEVPGGSTVWIERHGESHANDAMLLERFAIAVAITLSRAGSDSGDHRAAELVVDASAAPDDRASAAARLRLEAHGRVRAVARPAGASVPAGLPSALLSTPFGFAQVLLVSESATDFGDGPAGVGLPVEPGQLPSSWTSALVALRLSEARTPVVVAERLGSMLVLAEAADANPEPHPDVLALEQLGHDRSALPTLDAVTEQGSVRAAATVLGVHHSTVQARLTTLSDALGYDPRTPDGRTRYTLARTLQRLRNTRW